MSDMFNANQKQRTANSPRNQWCYLSRLLTLLWRFNSMGILIICMLVITSGILPIILLEALRRFIESATIVIIEGSSIIPALPWLGIMLAINLFNQIINATTYWLSLHLNQQFKEYAQEQVLKKASEFSLVAFEDHTLYDQLQRAQRCIEHHLVWIANQLPTIPVMLFTAIGLLVYVGSAHFIFPMILIIGVIPIMIIDARYGRKRWQLTREQTSDERSLEYLDKLMTQRISAAEIRLFGLQKYLLNKRLNLFLKLSKERLNLARQAFIRGNIGQIYTPLTLFFVIAAVIVWNIQGLLSVSYFITYISAVQSFTRSLWRLVSSTTRLDSELHYMRDLFEYLDIETNELLKLQFSSSIDRHFHITSATLQTKPNQSHEIINGTIPTIRFNQVGFVYPNTKRPVLDGINLVIRPGERLALVGENGAGKTTLAKLLLGLYRPTAGEITINGVNLNDIDSLSWRTNVGAVFQNYMQYELTVRENIGFGKLDFMDDTAALTAAAIKSGADVIISSLPIGYETILGKTFDDNGRDLSKGQWQKLAIARVYLRNAKVLVLDEPTSALDARSEIEVYRQFRDMAIGKSVLLISHRLRSARLADRILVLHEGRIIEEGHHTELIKQGGIYATMDSAQTKWFSR